ncbi:hypothetical protein EOL96_01235 [Candidatus Saccharibacteria bacterium]|nr:hypothetical protein [Candidatus Saccharibacteria bacterium]
MTMIILLVAVVVLAIMLSKKDSSMKNNVDYYGMSYRQGYWDGVRASEQKQVSSTAYVETPPISTAPQQNDPVQTTQSDGMEYVEVPLERGEDGYVTALEDNAPNASYTYSTQPSAPTWETSDQRRERNRNHTINIALYVASLLLVSGIILFAQTIGLPDVVRFAIVWLLILVLYIAGFVINARVPILKPAAVAFIGTALAAVPVAGIVMYYLVTQNAALCWLVTSLIGFVMYSVATVIIKSQLLAYVSILSLFIFSCTLPAVGHAQIMWYYVVMIVFGSVLTLLAHFKFAWVPSVFAIPITQLSPIAVPVALIGSVVSFYAMTPWEYTAVFSAAATYYIAQALVAVTLPLRTLYWVVARSLLIIIAVTVTAAITDKSLAMMSYAFAAAGIANTVVSASMLTPRVRNSMNQHEVMLWVGLGAAMLAPAAVLNVTDSANALIMTAEYSAIVLACMYGVARLRRHEFGWPMLFSLTVLPLLVGRFVAVPPLETSSLYVVFIAYIILALVIRWFRKARLGEAILLYTFTAIWFMITALMAIELGDNWGIAWWIAVAVVSYFTVINEKTDGMIVLGNISLLATLAVIGQVYEWPVDTTVAVITWVNAVAFLLLAEFVRVKGSRGYQMSKILQTGTLVNGAILGLIGLLAINDEPMRAASWLAIVGILYYIAWRSRSVVALFFGNAALVIDLVLITIMLQIEWLPATALLVWLPLTGFIVVSEFFKMTERRADVVGAMWVSGVAAAILFGVLALISGNRYGIEDDAMWRATAWLGTVVALYYSVYRSRSIALLYISNGAAVLLIALLGSWGALNEYQTTVCVAWFGLLGFYLTGYGYQLRYGVGRVWRAMFISSIVTTTLAGFLALPSQDATNVLAAGVALLGIGFVLVHEGSRRKRLAYIDAGAIIALIGLQRMIDVYFPGIHYLFYTHLWALLAAALALVYRAYGTRVHAHIRLFVALTLMSFPALNYALSGSEGAQVIFLVEHVLLVVAGLIYVYRAATWWGAVGVTMAVFYMLRGYTSLLTITIGLLVIGAVVYVIIKTDKNNKLPPPNMQE